MPLVLVFVSKWGKSFLRCALYIFHLSAEILSEPKLIYSAEGRLGKVAELMLANLSFKFAANERTLIGAEMLLLVGYVYRKMSFNYP